jgi:meso-butanediol dehydrogenase / (S,S)-butanediol dehydrogenase / diacetyl reductase
MENRLLEDKIIFLTGGGDGIGHECALEYARDGATVIIADINEAAAQQTASQLATQGLAVRCDVTDADSVESAVRMTLAKYGRIDAVHNNAGLASPSVPLEKTTRQEWDRLMAVNLTSVYLTTRYTLFMLKAHRGVILNTASMAGVIGQSNHAAYVATKGAIIGLTKAMALDYAPLGIRVNAICPAGVWTPMLKTWASEQPDPAGIEEYLKRIHPLGYCPGADVVASAAAFLLSDQARFITGCILPVSGGAELGYRL